MSFEFAFLISLPIILLVAIFLGHIKYKGMFEEIGLSSREIGLLVIAPIFASLFNLPIWIGEEYLLALNIGGALIPIILSFYFLRKKEISFASAFLGIAIISIPTFFITRFVEGVGICSNFPYYLIPPLIASLIGLVFLSNNSSKTPGYSYAIATLGVLIGGDIFHLPEIFQHPFTGSLGGAGIYDMVFIAGLLALCIDIPFMSPRLKKLKRKLSPSEISSSKIDCHLTNARMDDDPQESLRFSLAAVQEKTREFGKKFGFMGDMPSIIHQSLGEIASRDYWLLASKANDSLASSIDANRGVIASELLINSLSKKEGSYYASLRNRIFAFLIDFLVIVAIAFLMNSLISAGTNPAISYSLWIFGIQLIYFTILEYKWNTPGKMILGIKVSYEDGKFISSFTRNVMRFVDMLLGFYLISSILIFFSSKHQRFGDMVARTTVTKLVNQKIGNR